MNLESQLRSIAASVPEGRLRLFGCECCRRLSPYYDHPAIARMIALAELRSTRHVSRKKISEICDPFDAVYEALENEYLEGDCDDGSPAMLALCAAFEVACVDSSFDAAVGAAEFTARSIAKYVCFDADPAHYDEVYEPAVAAEVDYQKKLLVRFFRDDLR